MKIFTIFAGLFRYMFRVEASNEIEARNISKRLTTERVDRVVEGDVYNDYKRVDNKIVRK